MHSRSLLLSSALGFLFLPIAHGQLIVDDFEVDSLADYTFVETASGDGTATRFDYIAAGIPLAPRSLPGDRHGLRMTANDSLGAAYAVTAFHNTPVTLSAYSLLVDIWLNVDRAAGATTEHAHIGVGGDGATFNQLFGPTSGSGSFLAMDGDGGSSSDYRWFRDGTLVPTGDPSYLSDAQTTNASDPLYQSIYPGGDFPGSPGNRWTTLQIDVEGSTISYSLDGTPIILGSAVLPGNRASLGYADLFSSIESTFQAHFVVYDNLEVGEAIPPIPEPAAAFSPLVIIGALALLRLSRRQR